VDYLTAITLYGKSAERVLIIPFPILKIWAALYPPAESPTARSICCPTPGKNIDKRRSHDKLSLIINHRLFIKRLPGILSQVGQFEY
jgi:hypothetical protein